MSNHSPNLSQARTEFELISRADAAARGLKSYFTGLPCRNGHIAQRYVSTTGCHRCVRPYAHTANGNDNYISDDLTVVHIPQLVAKGRTIEELNAVLALIQQTVDDWALLNQWPVIPGDEYERKMGVRFPPLKYNGPSRYGNT